MHNVCNSYMAKKYDVILCFNTVGNIISIVPVRQHLTIFVNEQLMINLNVYEPVFK